MKKLTICFAIIVALAFSHNTFAGKWYWVPTSDNTWGVNANGQVDSTSWSMTSGGSGGQGYPGANDTVYFDANSFNQDVNTVFIHGTVSAFVVDMSGLSGLPFSPVYMQSYSDPQTYAYNDTINILGRLIFNANMNISGFYGRMNLHTNSSDTLSLSNQNYLQFSIGLYGGSWTLGSNLSFINNGNAGSDGSFSLYKGVSFNLNGYSLLVNGFTVQDTMVSITMPKGSTLQVSSIFDLSQHSPKISMDPGTLINLEVNYSDTKLRLGNYGQSTFNGGALKYSNVSCFTNTIITGANTFDTLRLYNGDSIYLANSDTQRFTYLYSYANNGNFNAINGGPNMATLQSLSGSRECLNYTNFTNIKAQGAKFYIYGGTYIDTAGFTLVPSLMDTINKSVNISAGCRNGLNAQIAAGATGGLPPYSFVWYNFTTQISDTVHQDTLKTAISGATYSVSVVDQCGQIYAHLNSIVVNNLNTDTIAPAVVPNDTILCGTGHSVLLYANTQTSNVSYLWSPAAGIPNTTVDSNQVTVYQTTTYKVQLTRGTCVQIDSINVTVENPKAKVSVDTLNVCQGNTFTLDGSNSTGLVAGYNPLWTNNSQTAYFPDSLKVTGNAYVAGTTVYYLKLFGDNSCLSVDSVVVNVSDSITGATTSRDTILCGLSHAIYLTASTTNQPKVNFTWSPTIGLGATQGDSTLLTPVKTTTYTATFTNGACILKKEVNVAVQNPVATISPDTLTVCQGALVTLDAQSSSGYTLTPSWTNNKKISLNYFKFSVTL